MKGLDEIRYIEENKDKIISALESYYKGFIEGRGMLLVCCCIEDDLDFRMVFRYMKMNDFYIPKDDDQARGYLKRIQELKD
ncbi:hypothetical protein KY343_00810 [Candidatus Woesearchaeota archaeon]|nr:hypothetical protein [Candidatus Woesearchaeota archaeon]